MEFQFYLLSPFIMWAAFSLRRKAPRRFGLAGLAAGSLVAPLINLILDQKHTVLWFSYTFTVLRSSPYFAGLFCSVVVQQALLKRRAAQQLPTAALPTAGAAADGGGCPGAEASVSLSKSGSSSGGVLDKGASGGLDLLPAAAAAKAPSKAALVVSAACSALSAPIQALRAPWAWPARCPACAWLLRLPWRRILLFICDWAAVLVGCTLAWTGVGPSW